LTTTLSLRNMTPQRGTLHQGSFPAGTPFPKLFWQEWHLNQL